MEVPVRWLALVSLATACGATPGGSDAGADCNGAPKNPPMLVKNAGFECGGDTPTEWSVQYGDFLVTADAHSGSRGARLTPAATLSGQFAYAPVVANPSAASTYCATAWVKGTVPNMKLSLLVDTGGGGTEYAFTSPVASPTWLRAPPTTALSVPTPAGAKVYLRLMMKDARAGDTLFVDDVDVWLSASGRCDETR